MNKTRGQSVLKILNGGVKSLNYPPPPGSKFSISWGGWRCELGGFNPPKPPVKSNPAVGSIHYFLVVAFEFTGGPVPSGIMSSVDHVHGIKRLDSTVL